MLDPETPRLFSPNWPARTSGWRSAWPSGHGIPVRLGPAAENLLTTVISAGGQWPDFAAVIEALTSPR